MYSLYYVLG